MDTEPALENRFSVGRAGADGAFRPVPWRISDLVRASLAALALLLAGLILVVVVAAAAGIAGLDITDQKALRSIAFFAVALEAVFIPPAWLWGPRKHGLNARWLGLRAARPAKSAALVAAGLVVILGINLLWGVVMQAFDIPGQVDLVPLFGEGPYGLLSAIVVACIVAPVAEEIFFRGFVYPGMRDRWGLAIGVAVSALVFSVFHMSLNTLIPIALMGAVLAVLYERANSLWPCIALHALVNLLGVVGAYAAA